VLWQFDATRSFTSVNGVVANGASMLGPGPAVAGGMVFVPLAFGIDERIGFQADD
jgi:hypothetical protein